MREKYNKILYSRLNKNKIFIEKEIKKDIIRNYCTKSLKRSNVICGIKWR